ncbi:MAG: zinc dependent phospholipase C family protein [Candidatus Acidiferrales bacterium]
MKFGKRFASRTLALSIIVLLLAPPPSSAYAVLAHEAIVDAAWDEAIKPLLLERFPQATPEDLKSAHAYAYGGCVIQDMGYYPFGNKFFSDLVHYVRSGDFVAALLRDSQNLNEYAFALGALAHYSADNEGHRTGTNLAVPLLYPKLRRKYGDVVTYDENPLAHLKTEFGFDVLQVAKGRYASDAYRDRIGFQVSSELLARAFQETYSLDLNSVLSSYDLAIASYRRAVSQLIPEATKIAWQTKKDEIQRGTPGITRTAFLYRISRSTYEKQWPGKYEKPGFGTRLLGFLLRLIPKVGPFRDLAFKIPTPEAEKLFVASFSNALQNYVQLANEQRSPGLTTLVDDNFDTGTVTGPGQYPLADQTYAALLDRLQKNNFATVSPELKTALLAYYADLNAPFATKKDKKEWSKVVRDVNQLKASRSAEPPTVESSSLR